MHNLLREIIIASHNQGKIKEISELLRPYGVTIFGGPDFNLEEPEENADSFIGNAQIKSNYFAKVTGKAALSDDSGLVIPALDGEPGIYSARWAGEDKNFHMAIEKIRQKLEDKSLKPSGQKAYFICALSLTLPDGTSKQWEGRVDGVLTFPAKGKHGFGYDPIFIPDLLQDTEYKSKSFAEIPAAEKHKISHRADAFLQFVEECFT